MGYDTELTELWRRPTIQPDDTILFDEPGRRLAHDRDHVCYRSYWFVVIDAAHYGGHWLLVKHGGGEERISLGYRSSIQALEKLSSDERYCVLWTIRDTHHRAAEHARDETASRYAMAFLDKRLKKRKRNHVVRVVIMPKIAALDAQPLEGA